jgi:hypothetical protein
MERKIINLTPHKISIFKPNNDVFLKIEPSGHVARCVKVRNIDADIFCGVPIHHVKRWRTIDLPATQSETIYIVSDCVALIVPERKDVFVVDEPVISRYTGKVVGYRALAHV